MAVPDALDRLAAELGPALHHRPRGARRVPHRQERLDDAGDAARGGPRPQHARTCRRRCGSRPRTGIPVVPRGAGTGLAGGAVGSAGALVLDVAAMDRVLEIDAADEIAVVQPGVVTDDLAAALAPHGLWWPPDPASRAISTVGGNIATNAGGLLCAKYGVTRESVLGLAVVLADGTPGAHSAAAPSRASPATTSPRC